MARGRRVVEDTKPGQVLLLGIVANAPIALAFILAPVFAREDPRGAALALAPLVKWVTPLFAAWGVVVFARAPRERGAHRAARIGILLCSVALLMWALVLLAPT